MVTNPADLCVARPPSSRAGRDGAECPSFASVLAHDRRTDPSATHSIKVRQQLERRLPNADPTSSRPRTTNALRTLTHMVRTEGLTSIYKGLSGSLLREISYSCVPPVALLDATRSSERD